MPSTRQRCRLTCCTLGARRLEPGDPDQAGSIVTRWKQRSFCSIRKPKSLPKPQNAAARTTTDALRSSGCGSILHLNSAPNFQSPIRPANSGKPAAATPESVSTPRTKTSPRCWLKSWTESSPANGTSAPPPSSFRAALQIERSLGPRHSNSRSGGRDCLQSGAQRQKVFDEGQPQSKPRAATPPRLASNLGHRPTLIYTMLLREPPNISTSISGCSSNRSANSATSLS